MTLVLAVYVTLILLWLAHASASVALAIGGFAAAIGAGYFVVSGLYSGCGRRPPVVDLVASAATVIWHLWQTIIYRRRPRTQTAEMSASTDRMVEATRTDHRGWLTTQQAAVLKWGALGGALLLIAGFGHDLVFFLFYEGESALSGAATKAGGWGVLLVTAATTIYTAIKAAPSTDGTTPPPPGRSGKAALMLAPRSSC